MYVRIYIYIVFFSRFAYLFWFISLISWSSRFVQVHVVILTNIWIEWNLLGLEFPAQVTNHSQHRASGRDEDAPGIRRWSSLQELDFSASDEEVERSSTSSLSREAVPKEAPGSLVNGTFILVLRSFSLPPLFPPISFSLIFALSLLAGCSHLIRRRYQRVPGRKTRIIESIVSHPPSPRQFSWL